MTDNVTYSHATSGVSQTKELASRLAPHLRAGDIIMLNGDLGAGKTQFVQGIAHALGIEANVMSPTFNIVLQYEGPHLRINHFDLYRLDTKEQLEDIGYWELLEGDGASFIEWGDKFPDSSPDDYLEVRIERTGESDRLITCRSHGDRPRDLLESWSRDGGPQQGHSIDSNQGA